MSHRQFLQIYLLPIGAVLGQPCRGDRTDEVASRREMQMLGRGMFLLLLACDMRAVVCSHAYQSLGSVRVGGQISNVRLVP